MPATGGQSPEERQAGRIRELAASEVDFLLIGAGDGPLVRSAVEQAVARGVPLGALSSELPVELLIFKIGPDHQALGRLQAECLGTALAGRGSLALLSGPTDRVANLEQTRGFKETLARRFPGLRLVAERAASFNRAAAAEQVDGWLAHQPDLSGLAATAEEPTLGALDALWEAGRLGRTKVATTGLGPIGEASLRDGGLHCAAVPQAVAEGRAAIRNAVDYLAHRPYQKSITIPPLLLTRENVERVDWGPIRAP
jgi:ABC-type sugar transport system substrate-binding protein